MVLLRNGNVSGFTSGGSSSKLAQYNFFLIYKFVLYILIRGSSSARRFLLPLMWDVPKKMRLNIMFKSIEIILYFLLSEAICSKQTDPCMRDNFVLDLFS